MNTARGEAGRIHDQAKTEGYNQGLNQALEDISQDMAGIQAAVDRLGQGLEEFKRQMNGGTGLYDGRKNTQEKSGV